MLWIFDLEVVCGPHAPSVCPFPLLLSTADSCTATSDSFFRPQLECYFVREVGPIVDFIKSYSLLFYCCDKILWPSKHTEEGLWLGLWFQSIRIRNGKAKGQEPGTVAETEQLWPQTAAERKLGITLESLSLLWDNGLTGCKNLFFVF